MLTIQEVFEAVKDAKKKVTWGKPLVGEIHESGNKEVAGIDEEDFVLYVQLTVPFEGDLPEDYRVLNALVSDFVSERKETLEEISHKPVLAYIVSEYPGADSTELRDGLGEFLWEGQVDYIPLIDYDNNIVYIVLELILAMESDEDLEQDADEDA